MDIAHVNLNRLTKIVVCAKNFLNKNLALVIVDYILRQKNNIKIQYYLGDDLMKYTLRFFTHYGDEEELLKGYEFDSMPYIPRKKDLISIDDEQYLVRRVATDYDDENDQLFEVMMDRVDYSKEWWE